MKKTLIAAALLAAVCAGLSAQTEEAGETTGPQLLLHNNKGWPYRPARLLDGSAEGRLLTFKESLKTLSVVPENAALVKSAKGWWIASNIFSGISAAGVIGMTVFTFGEDLPNRDTMRSISSAAVVTAAFFAVLGDLLHQRSFSRAVGNYNLYIQGIPIPAGK